MRPAGRGTDAGCRGVDLVSVDQRSGFFAAERGCTYLQSDGLVLEQGTSNVQIPGLSSANLGGGGFDLKSDGVQLAGCSATGGKYGVRIWRQNRTT